MDPSVKIRIGKMDLDLKNIFNLPSDYTEEDLPELIPQRKLTCKHSKDYPGRPVSRVEFRFYPRYRSVEGGAESPRIG